MDQPGKHRSNKVLVFASMAILLAAIMFVVILTRPDNSDATISLDLSLSITPTPCSLPTQVYRTPSFLSKVFGQIIGSNEDFLDPAGIIENSHIVSSGERLDTYLLYDKIDIDTQWWQQEAGLVYEYVTGRLETTIDEKVIVVFMPPRSGNCAPRGASFHEQEPSIVIFANQDTSKEQILAVFAHELGHVFINQRYENLSDIALNEGMATWAAGDYWKEWKGRGCQKLCVNSIIINTPQVYHQNEWPVGLVWMPNGSVVSSTFS